MVASITSVPEQQHMPRAQARVGGQDAYVRFDFGACLDSSTSTISFARQTPDQSHVEDRNRAGEYCCNQQYSVTAITTSTGTIAERYTYSAYGQPTILDASGSILSTSSISNRYTYTGREWDATLGLNHFRARWMSPSAGRFLRRDPIGYFGSEWNLYEDVGGQILSFVDPLGLCHIDYCENLLDEIKNLIKEIEKRRGELHENPQGLPEYHPDDDRKPSKSKRGHRRMLNQHKANLANKVGRYLARCGNLPPDVLPLPIDVPVEQVVPEPEPENPIVPLIPVIIPEPFPTPNPPTPSIPPVRPWWGWPSLGLPVFPLWLAPPLGDPRFPNHA